MVKWSYMVGGGLCCSACGGADILSLFCCDQTILRHRRQLGSLDASSGLFCSIEFVTQYSHSPAH